MTARQFAKRQLLGFLVTCLTSAVVLVSVLFWAGHSTHEPPPSPAAEPSASRTQQLVEKHACWSGQAPRDMQGRVPGHVVVTTRTGRTVYAGQRTVIKALDQLFADKPAGLHIHGFCR